MSWADDLTENEYFRKKGLKDYDTKKLEDFCSQFDLNSLDDIRVIVYYAQKGYEATKEKKDEEQPTE